MSSLDELLYRSHGQTADQLLRGDQGENDHGDDDQEKPDYSYLDDELFDEPEEVLSGLHHFRFLGNDVIVFHIEADCIWKLGQFGSTVGCGAGSGQIDSNHGFCSSCFLTELRKARDCSNFGILIETENGESSQMAAFPVSPWVPAFYPRWPALSNHLCCRTIAINYLVRIYAQSFAR